MALLNYLLMRQPMLSDEIPRIVALIPARNEGDKIGPLVAELVQQGLKVVVFNDESEDNTADEVIANGGIVIEPSGPLPDGWLGKNRGCHELAQYATNNKVDWLLFLDADVTPEEDFTRAASGMVEFAKGKETVITGFPRIVPGRFMEPMFMAWIGWIILAFNPLGLISRTGLGHGRFLNGQFQIWPAELYARLQPHQAMRSEVMEDVMIGRLLARNKIKVEAFRLSEFLAVKMYTTWRECLDGFSKNAYCITNNVVGTVALAILFLGAGAYGMVDWLAYMWLFLSGFIVALIVQAPLWPAFAMPLNLLIGGFTLLRSLVWHRTGKVRWKGRVVSK